MSLFTSIKNLFRNPGPRKSSYQDDTADVGSAPKAKPTLSLTFPQLPRIALIRNSQASKADTERSKYISTEASALDDHGDIDPQASQKPTDSVTSHSGPSPSSQRPRASSTVSHETIQTTVHNPLHNYSASQPSAPSSTSVSTASSSLDTSSTDLESDRHVSERSDESLNDEDDDEDDDEGDDEDDEEYNTATAKTRALFENPDPSTRDQRRKALYELRGEENISRAANWLYDHPDDLWDTTEEQEANFTRMLSDDRIEVAAQDDVKGLEWLRGRPDYKVMRKRAKDAGWHVALQETVFREEWFAEGGMFGEKGSGGPLPEEVGPMGETL